MIIQPEVKDGKTSNYQQAEPLMTTTQYSG